MQNMHLASSSQLLSTRDDHSQVIFLTQVDNKKYRRGFICICTKNEQHHQTSNLKSHESNEPKPQSMNQANPMLSSLRILSAVMFDFSPLQYFLYAALCLEIQRPRAEFSL
jgi:hypothetical protein